MKRRTTQIARTIVILFGGALLCAGSSAAELDLVNGKKVYALCASCHMKNGWGKPDGSFPVLAGQHRKVLLKQLEDIRAKNRQNPTMYPFANPAEIGGVQAMNDVTAYIAGLPENPAPGRGKGDALGRGKQLYEKHCAQCHGEKGAGNNEALYPKLSGQHYAYLTRQLRWIRDGYRNNANPAMVVELSALSDADTEAVADYISRL